MVSSLPPEVLALVEMHPVEDIALKLLKDRLPWVPTGTQVAVDQTFPFILVRNSGAYGEWNGDPRFLDAATLTVGTFCQGPNGDEDANLLAEAVRVTLRDAVNVNVPGLGHLTGIRMVNRPRRVTDWATATGPVQYADLPNDAWRWETVYDITIKKPRSS